MEKVISIREWAQVERAVQSLVHKFLGFALEGTEKGPISHGKKFKRKELKRCAQSQAFEKIKVYARGCMLQA